MSGGTGMADDRGPDDMAPDDMLAMEWALGVLDGPAHRAADSRRLAEPAFAALCAAWAEQLVPLADEIAPEAPPPALWGRIEAAIAEPAPRREAPEAAAGWRWWNDLVVWRGLSAALAAVALALIVTRPPGTVEPAPAPPAPAAPAALLAATLAADGGPPLVTISVDPARSAAVLSPVSAADLDGRVPELWVIPADGRPRSLGVIDLGGTRQLRVPATLLQLVAEGAVLAVSLEPVGGSPTGQPTGPVVATGKLASI